MRHFPNGDQDDLDQISEMLAVPWQIELLNKNPDYTSWGNYEDYMYSGKAQWDKCLEVELWPEFKADWHLDNLNELVNFYFEIYRKNHICPACDQSGKAPAYKKISDDWYTHLRTDGKQGWQYELTEIEIEALVKRGRLCEFMPYNVQFDEQAGKWMGWVTGEKQEVAPPKMPTPAQVNRRVTHDAINHWIAAEARAKHLGVYGVCEECKGKGIIYDEEFARVGLQLWIIHPRKGCSRGVYIKNIEQHEVLDAVAYLNGAAERNQKRFSRL